MGSGRRNRPVGVHTACRRRHSSGQQRGGQAPPLTSAWTMAANSVPSGASFVPAPCGRTREGGISGFPQQCLRNRIQLRSPLLRPPRPAAASAEAGRAAAGVRWGAGPGARPRGPGSARQVPAGPVPAPCGWAAGALGRGVTTRRATARGRRGRVLRRPAVQQAPVGLAARWAGFGAAELPVLQLEFACGFNPAGDSAAHLGGVTRITPDTCQQSRRRLAQGTR